MEMTWVREGLYFYMTHLPEITFTVGVIILLGLFSLPWNTVDNWEWLNIIPMRRGMMLRKARRQHVQELMLDDFVDRIEERVFSTEITREEAKEVYRNLKKCFPVRDLFPSPELLKEAIQKRLAAHIHDPVDLPKIKRKHMFEK